VETRNHTDFNEINQRTVAGNNALLAHDKNGNTTDTGAFGASFPGSGLKLEWDALNRLRKVHKWDPASFSYQLVAEHTYDCHNRRIRKVVTNSGAINGTTDFCYEGWRVVEERDGADAVTQQYTYGNYLDEVWTLDNRRGGITVVQLNDGTGSQRHFYHQNTLYSVFALTNEAGTIVEAVQYTAYGTPTIWSGAGADATWFTNDDVVSTTANSAPLSAAGNPYLYTGQRFDPLDLPETGIMYYKNRYYQAGLGRFVSRDPLGPHAGRMELYHYVKSNPTNRTDRFGYDDFTDIPAQHEGNSPSGGAKGNPKAVVCIFSRKKLEVCCKRGEDKQCCPAVAAAETDEKKEYGPTPVGEYLVGTQYQHPRNNVDWYNLYPRKEDNSGYYPYREKNKLGRNTMGLHPGTVSEGCVTVQKGDDCWDKLKKVINGGSMKYKNSDYKGFLYVVDK
jgi:RHS repeat-associated protein